MHDRSRARWKQLSLLLDLADQHGLTALSVAQVKELCRLYRQVSIDLSQARTEGAAPELLSYLNTLASRAHGRVYGANKTDLKPALGFIPLGFPRLVRRHWRPLVASAAIFLATTVASFIAVVRQPTLAYSIFDENTVEYENWRLKNQKGEYRGNFELIHQGNSPESAAKIIVNNVRVAAMSFALGAAACLPGTLLLAYNGRMLGTLSGLTFNRGYAMDFYALVLTHGVLELSAIVIASGAGLMLGWSLIAPGADTRLGAFKKNSPDAMGLLLGSAFLLVLAGMIEAFVTPHFGQAVRWSVAAGTGVLLTSYLAFSGIKMKVDDQSKPLSTISR